MTVSIPIPLAVEAPAFACEPRTCFHCALPLNGAAYPVVFDGVAHDTCCAGCQSIAQTIFDNGLGAYYQARTAPPPPVQTPCGLLNELKLYDLAHVQHGFVRVASSNESVKEAALLLEGITCAACVWLIEQRLSKLDGVRQVCVNYAARRARVTWNESETKLSKILRAVAELGYRAQPYDSMRSDDVLRRERQSMLRRLFISGLGMMQVMMYAVPAYISDGTMTADIEQLMRIASFVLTTPVALWAALPFYGGAWREIRNRRVGMDVPVAAGIIVAYVASVVATTRGSGPVYFDSVAMFVFLLLGARFLEMGARAKAADAQQRLSRLTPAIAERLDRYPDPQAREQVAALALEAGDVVLVRPGASIPADGIVIDGTSAADESLLTGEARPISRTVGETVTGGSVNLHGPLVVRVERVGEASTLAGIVRLMDRAQSEKPAIALAAERAARSFVTVVLAVAVGAAAGWYAIDPSRAMEIAIAVLIVTCPCALSLAIPAVLTSATGALYGSRVLVTRGHALETLARATHVVFDKTGTLTLGRMSLIDVILLGNLDRNQCLELAAGLESQSEHPLGRAITAACATPVQVSEVLNVAGEGVEARAGETRLRIGTPRFVSGLHGQPLPPQLGAISDDLTLITLGSEHGWLALLTFGDALRTDARITLAQLRAQGKTLCLLSGDRQTRVEQLARVLGIAHACGDATPGDKVEFVSRLQQQGAIVAMIGDGINDAPVLAQAQVSLAMAGGAELAHVSADMIVMSERLDPVLQAVRIARFGTRIIRQNLAWAALYNAVALPLAVLGYLTPLIAAAGMSLSSLIVVLNALRVLRPSPGGEGNVRGAAAWTRPVHTA